MPEGYWCGFFLGCSLHAYWGTLVTVGVSEAMDNADGKRDRCFSNGYDFGHEEKRLDITVM